MTAPTIMEKYKAEYKKACRRIPDRRTELEYVNHALTGNRAAKNTLIYKYVPFLYAMAIKIKHRYNATIDEMVNASIMGFDKALAEFDKTRGTSFYTYYIPKAYNEMRKECYGSLLVHRSEGKLKKQRTEEDLKTVSVVSIYKEDDTGRSIMDALTSDATTDEDSRIQEVNTLVDEFMSVLPPVEKEVVNEFYINNPDGISLNQIGSSLGICRERVRQIRNRALERIRQSAKFEDVVASERCA